MLFVMPKLTVNASHPSLDRRVPGVSLPADCRLVRLEQIGLELPALATPEVDLVVKRCRLIVLLDGFEEV